MTDKNALTPEEKARRSNNRKTVSGLVFLFIVPVILAYVAFYMGWFTQPTRNHGEIMEKPYPRFEQFQWFDAEDKPLHFRDFETQWWWLYFPKSNECDSECELNIRFLTRTHAGMGKRTEKLTKLIVFPSDIQYQDRIKKPQQMRLAKGKGSPQIGEQVQLEIGHIYAMDVHGNIFMKYKPVTSEADARQRSANLRKDIERVMKNTGL